MVFYENKIKQLKKKRKKTEEKTWSQGPYSQVTSMQVPIIK